MPNRYPFNINGALVGGDPKPAPTPYSPPELQRITKQEYDRLARLALEQVMAEDSKNRE